MKDLVNPPDAARAIFGFRDTGYNVKTAAADIIDNSIAAGATEINISIDLLADGRKIVCFGDNGEGMVSATLRPYAARLDGWLKRHGMRSSIPLCG